MVDKTVYLYNKFIQYNKELFNNSLPLPTIATDTTLECLGMYGGLQSTILVKDQLFEGDNQTLRCGPRWELGRMAFVDGVLLHEMVHQFTFETQGLSLLSKENGWHNKLFCSKCDEIGNKLNYRSCQAYAVWPISAVCPSYFLNAFIDEHRIQAYLM